jgi:hypothetical protein
MLITELKIFSTIQDIRLTNTTKNENWLNAYQYLLKEII